MIKRIGLLTSGGDSPGMNACIRAVVRTALYHQIEVVGFLRGYDGLIDNQFCILNHKEVSGIINKGGTILKTARSERFRTTEGLKQAVTTIQQHTLDGMIVIGGDGSFRGAIELAKHSDIAVLGCAGTIDNDLVGTDFTIGYDTAINTAVDAIDKIRDTAESHDRVFIIEMMGRDAGLIALRSAIAGGAEALLIPELNNDLGDLIEKIKGWRHNKGSRIIVVSEGDEVGGAYKLAETIKPYCAGLDVKVSVLGHIQRGGAPTCMERVNASIVGYHAVQELMAGKRGCMVGIINRQIALTPFENAVKHIERIDPVLEKLIKVLSH